MELTFWKIVLLYLSALVLAAMYYYTICTFQAARKLWKRLTRRSWVWRVLS